MCKIMVLTNMTKVKSVPKLVNAISRAIDDERDGFGYAIQSETGLYGERTLKPDGFRYSMKRPVMNLPFTTKSYERFGQESKPSGAGIFHGRTSTNDASLLNTHPLQKHDWTLIHNGVVSDHGPKYVMRTTNDTEHVLERLATGGINAVAEHLTGYYAIAAFDPQGQLHMFRDNRAPLYFGHIESIDSYMVATTEESIADVCKAMQWKVSILEMLADNHYLVWRDNEIISQTTFKPRGATPVENRYADLSLRETSGNTFTAKRDDYFTADQYFGETAFDLSEYTQSEILFLEEISTSVDSTYKILDYRGNSMDLEEFFSLNPDEQLTCTFVRPDGTVGDSSNFSTEVLFEGRVS